MIVIAIIGILAAALFPMMTGYMARSRDTARVADLGQISLALSTYYTDLGTFPQPLPSSAGTCLSSIALASRLAKVPKDPSLIATAPCVSIDGTYAYTTGTKISGTGVAMVYALAATMEV